LSRSARRSEPRKIISACRANSYIKTAGSLQQLQHPDTVHLHAYYDYFYSVIIHHLQVEVFSLTMVPMEKQTVHYSATNITAMAILPGALMLLLFITLKHE